ncbi:hypothetical protein CHISP_2733 [Chitinispirillum alkaliphilum]|nr:hypothetical protein CHISP_2733 [Chitinispirillum alkaliphilum]
MNILFKKLFKKSSAILVLLITVFGLEAQSVQQLYSIAAENYDRSALYDLIEVLESDNTIGGVMLKAKSYWRLQFIAYSEESRKEVNKYGKKALQYLEKAREAGKESLSVMRYEVFIMQKLADGGIFAGTVWGPRIISVSSQLERHIPQDYATRFSRAITLVGAPPLFGGNREAGVDTLSSLIKQYPDSVDLKVQRANGYRKMGNMTAALTDIENVLERQPNNLLALRIKRELEKYLQE